MHTIVLLEEACACPWPFLTLRNIEQLPTTFKAKSNLQIPPSSALMIFTTSLGKNCSSQIYSTFILKTACFCTFSHLTFLKPHPQPLSGCHRPQKHVILYTKIYLLLVSELLMLTFRPHIKETKLGGASYFPQQTVNSIRESSLFCILWFCV